MTPALLVAGEPPQFPANAQVYHYAVYGLRLRSSIRLTLNEDSGEGPVDVELLAGDPALFEAAASKVTIDPVDWIHMHELPDGWSYIRYDEMFEFQISPSGDQIFFRLLAESSLESFQTYALGRVLSYALVKMGYEPLHASTIVVGGFAVAFLGASTFGKSSLAACFVASGYPLLTDDVLRVEERGNRYVAFPGPPKLKLLPRVACLYLKGAAMGVPINNKDHYSPKMVFHLSPEQRFAAPAPLAAVYVVTSPRKVFRKQRIAISPLPMVDQLVSVLSFTHNHKLTGPARLTRQLDAAQSLIEKTTVRSLSYPRILSSLPNVVTAVLADVKNYVDSL